MPGIRLFDVRAALAALGLAGLAALAMAIATQLPLSAPGGPPAQASSAGLNRLQSLPLQAQSVISSTIAADNRSFAARRTADGWGLSGGGVRADFRGGAPTLRLAGDSTLSLSLTGLPAPTSVTARGNRVTLQRSGVREWYAAGPLGIEQGFTLAHRLPATTAAAHDVTLALAVGGSLRPQAAGSNVNFLGSRGDVVARYGGLTAVDATGRHLPSALSVAGGRVLLSVNDRGARYPLTIDPLVQQGGKLVPNDFQTNGSGSQIGDSVALSADGNTALIGAQIDNSSKGAAWVFTRSNGAWTQLGSKIVPTDETNSSQFGTSVALSADGSTALIGGELDATQTGAAWVYVRSGGAYAEQRKLVGSGEVGFGQFGHSVSLSADGNTALIGGPADQGLGNAGVPGGSAWVFTRSGTTWTQQGPKLSPTLAPNNTNPSNFGTAVALSAGGNTAFIGGPGDNAGPGAVALYTRSGSTWSPQQKLTANNETGNSGFGASIDLSAGGTTAIFGGPSDNNTMGGAAWIFTGSGATWNQQAKLVPTNASGPADFGTSVAISSDGNTALIGADRDSNMVGAAYLFTRSAGVWTEQQRLTGGGETGFGFFGTSVALSSDGQTAMVGAPADTSETGAAFVFAPPAPVCSSVSATAPQGGGAVAVSLSCTLPSGAHPAFSILGGPSNGTVSGFNQGTGRLTYTSAKFFSGKDTFNYRVSDQWGISNIATAVVNVPFLPVPRCSNVTAKGKAGATRVTVTLKCTGPKGHSFTYGVVSKPGNGKLGKINQSNGKVTYTTHIGAQGTDRFVYNATNSGGSSKTATATIKLPTLGRITSSMNWDFVPGPTSTVVNSMSINALPGGAKVLLTCKGKGGCPISRQTISVPKHRVCKGKGKKRKCKLVAPKTARVDLTRFVAHKRLNVGTQIVVTMFESGFVGKRFTFTIVKNQQPPDRIQFMAPGSTTRLCPNC